MAVASGLGNARELLEQVKSGEKQYHFIEIMGCPGGCVNGAVSRRYPVMCVISLMYVVFVQAYCIAIVKAKDNP